MKKRIALIILALLFIGAIAWGPIVSNVEQAKYTVVESYDAIEIRNYAPMIVAEVEMDGEREKAISNGFRLIADYIFGNNTPAQSTQSTNPSTQSASEKIAMTAPVTQQFMAKGIWRVRFVMPLNYTLETLPKPTISKVKLLPIAEKRFAVIRFSGSTRQENLTNHLDQLNAFIDDKKLMATGEPIYAFFNPPWILPMFRRNEVMIELAQ